MSYDPETHRRYCDICGGEYPFVELMSYERGPGHGVQHICNDCRDAGAYWCIACDSVHASLDKCPQGRRPLFM
jgi:hypothetical protein